MNFHRRPFLDLLALVVASIGVITYGITHYTIKSQKENDARQSQAQFAQFERQLSGFGKEVAHKVEDVSNAEETTRMALDLARSNANPSLYIHDAFGAAREHSLDLLEITGSDGTVISSAQYPSGVRRKIAWLSASKDWSSSPTFFEKEQLPTGNALSLSAVRSSSVGDKSLRIIGGRIVDQNLLSSFELNPNVRLLLYLNLNSSTFEPGYLLDHNGVVHEAERFAPLVERLQRHPQPIVQTIDWTRDSSSAETFYLVPLLSRDEELVGIFLVGSSRREFVLFIRRIEWFAVYFAVGAFVVALPVCFWCSRRIAAPLATSTVPTRV